MRLCSTIARIFVGGKMGGQKEILPSAFCCPLNALRQLALFMRNSSGAGREFAQTLDDALFPQGNTA